MPWKNSKTSKYAFKKFVNLNKCLGKMHTPQNMPLKNSYTLEKIVDLEKCLEEFRKPREIPSKKAL